MTWICLFLPVHKNGLGLGNHIFWPTRIVRISYKRSYKPSERFSVPPKVQTIKSVSQRIGLDYALHILKWDISGFIFQLPVWPEVGCRNIRTQNGCFMKNSAFSHSLRLSNHKNSFIKVYWKGNESSPNFMPKLGVKWTNEVKALLNLIIKSLNGDYKSILLLVWFWCIVLVYKTKISLWHKNESLLWIEFDVWFKYNIGKWN